MKDFLRIELIKSLIFPGLCALWVIVRLVDEISGGVEFKGLGLLRLIAYVPAVLAGCVLPTILTLTRNIHTERYLKKRVIILIVTYVALSFLNLIGVAILYVFWYLYFGISSIIFQVFKVQEEDTPAGERAVLMLSDPVVYWTLFTVAIHLPIIFE